MLYLIINWLCQLWVALGFGQAQEELKPEQMNRDAENLEVARRLRAARNKQRRQEKKKLEKRQLLENLLKEEQEEQERARREKDKQQRKTVCAPVKHIQDEEKGEEGEWKVVNHRKNNRHGHRGQTPTETETNLRYFYIYSRKNQRKGRRSQEEIEESPPATPPAVRPPPLMSLNIECPPHLLPKIKTITAPCIQDEEEFPPLPRKDGAVASVVKFINSVWNRSKKDEEKPKEIDEFPKLEKKSDSDVMKKDANNGKKAEKTKKMEKTDLEASEMNASTWKIEPIGPPKKNPKNTKENSPAPAPFEPLWNATLRSLTEPLHSILDPFKEALQQGWVNVSSALTPTFSVWGGPAAAENHPAWE